MGKEGLGAAAAIMGYPNSFKTIMEDLLKYALEHGIINLPCIRNEIEMNKRKELLEKYGKGIWQGSNSKWYVYLPDDHKGRVLKKRNTRKEIEDLIIAFWEEKEQNPTVEEVFHEWNDRRLELKKISPATNLRNKQIFKRHFSEFGKRNIKGITAIDIEDFLEEQIARHDLTAKGFSNLKGVTSGFLKWAKRRKLIFFNVEEAFSNMDVSEISFRKVIKEDCEEVFNEQEMPEMMSYLKKHMDLRNLAIMLIFVTGIRVGELVALKRSDLTENGISISRTETKYMDKNGQYVYMVKDFPKSLAGVRTVIIPKSYLWILGEIVKRNPQGEFLFEENGKRMRTYVIRRRLESICKKIGFYPKSPHKIRKTYASILFDNNIDKKLIMEQMGHADILVGENHYHRNRRDSERKSQILSSIPDFDYQEIKSNHIE